MIRQETRTQGSKTKDLISCALFTTLIIAGAFIRIPVPVVPFTLQFLFTCLAGSLLGSRRGTISVIVYIVLGLIGLPIFAEGGGFWYVVKPTFGYLIGFCGGTFVTGYLSDRIYSGGQTEKTLSKQLIANFAGLIIVYAVGMAYCYIISNFVIGVPLGVWPLILYCFILAVPGDICLCILAALLTKRLRPIINI